MTRILLAVGSGILASTAALAQDTAAAPSPDSEADQDTIKREEVVVVSASRAETLQVDAPATLSVVTPDQITTSPAQNYGDLLRSVPGLNVIQTSARDINMVSRQATSTLATSQLVLLDGRSIYLDFFGMVLWDFVPQNPYEIKQIEVVRGPASVVWGANAMSGVVNIITRSPREAEGFTLNLTAGLLDRSGGSREAEGNGHQYGASFSFADAPNERFSWRLSAGYFDSDPYSRPEGVVGGCPLGTPCVPHPLDATLLTGGAAYPPDRPGAPGHLAFENRGTKQPKADVRLDIDMANGGRLTLQSGYAGTSGIVHTGLGPFDVQSPSWMAYGRAQYTRERFRLGAFVNFVDAQGPNLLLPDVTSPTLSPLLLHFKTQTWDLEVGNSNIIAGRHILSYGGNLRRNVFDISIAPLGEDRTEGGVYLQEEFFLERFRLAAGVRVDKLGNLDKAVISPRISVMFKPSPSHSIRASYNRAFRAPSFANNWLDLSIASGQIVDLGPMLPPPLQPLAPPPFDLIVRGVGSEVASPRYALKEEHVDAYELAYTGTIAGRATIGVAVYQNDQDDNINFASLLPTSQFPQGLPGLSFYSESNPARGISAVGPVSVPPLIMGLLPPNSFPETVFSFLNLGPIRQRGVEISVDHRLDRRTSASFAYSYQATPQVKVPAPDQIRYPNGEIGIPPKSRLHLGLRHDGARFVGSVSVDYTDKAFWVDVLDAPYHGYSDAFTMVNASLGVKWAEGRVVTSLKGTNLLDEKIQQHVFGDLIGRALVLEARFQF